MILGIILVVVGLILAIFAIRAMNQRPMMQQQRASSGGCGVSSSNESYNDGYGYRDNSGYRNRNDMSNQMSMSKDRFGRMSSNVMHGQASKREAQVVWTLVGGIVLIILGLIILIASRMGGHHRHRRHESKAHHTTAHHHPRKAPRKSRAKSRKKH